MAFKMQVDILKLFSQWAISTGEKSPKNYWGIFLLPLKALESSYQTATFHQRISLTPVGRKKNVSPSLQCIDSNTPVHPIDPIKKIKWAAQKSD